MQDIPNSRVPLNLPEGVFYIGLIGGIGAGKSTVAREFAKLGAGVVEADRITHQLLDQPEIRCQLEQRWGTCIVDKEGRVDRRAVAAIVFGTEASAPAERQYLESLLHPRVAKEIEQEIRRLVSEGCRVIVLDIPLLVELGWADRCQLLVFVDAPATMCWQRLQARRWTWSEFLRRQLCQIPLEKKRKLAQVVIDNSGQMEKLCSQVAQIWQTVIDRLRTSH